MSFLDGQKIYHYLSNKGDNAYNIYSAEKHAGMDRSAGEGGVMRL